MRCPTCGSPEPGKHPVVQSGGEVHICIDVYHLTPTNLSGSDANIAAVKAERERCFEVIRQRNAKF